MSRLISTLWAPDGLFAGWPPAVLDPAGPYAGSIAVLTWVLFAIALLVLAVVGTALWIALWGKQRTRQRLGGSRLIWIAGIAFPVVVLTLLLVYGLRLTSSLSAGTGPRTDLRIRVTGEMWWWRVAYLDAEGRVVSWDANELHIPVGRTVELELESADVIHSFWVPRLSGKTDMIPGRRNLIKIQADAPGVYAGQCAEYCGGPHALMGFVVIAQPPADFARFMRAASHPAAPPPSPGRQLFETAGCAACHRIAGTPANGMEGPDLTLLGRRRTLGAGILPNNHGTLMGWIGDSQAIKPGNRMPPFSMLSSAELDALATYLEQRK
ncbi:MAG TPA: cytochrome c oxidase subunit II [Sphingomicrobium sp.]|nr:cytochrome c oxidase subunit II [Sphingomicrobium sp.]